MAEATSTDNVLDVLVLGAGFAGLHAVYRLRESGFKVLGVEAASDVGGAWYWNRYPGARCDVESLVYCYTFSPLLDEGWRWSERYAKRDEICAYLRWVADKLDLRRDIRFNSRIVSAVFDDRNNWWTFRTQAGDSYRARHFFSAAGPITTPIMPDIPGIKEFKGPVIHTARWPERDPDFTGKRVALLTAVRSRAAICSAPRWSQLRANTRNSSPPRRAAVSPGRRLSRNAPASARSTSSPAVCPLPSLMDLKSSMSTSSAACESPLFSAQAASMATRAPRRLGSPVNESCMENS